MPAAVWNASHWNAGDTWQGPTFPPGAGWGDDWQFWYQLDASKVLDLTPMVVEARWTSDSHTTGDGTYRGDIQPGKLALRLWDPAFTLEGLDKLGTVWAYYAPTGAMWCWFFDTFTRALVAPGDPTGADCVLTGLVWPARLTNPVYAVSSAPGVQSVNARLSWIAAYIGAPQDQSNLRLPPLTARIAPQTQSCAAEVADQYGFWPSWLQWIRDAAADGVAYLQPAGTAGAGTLTLCYDRWETVNAARTLAGAQVVTGPPVGQAVAWLLTRAWMDADNGTGGITSMASGSSNLPTWQSQMATLRMWGRINSSDPEYTAVAQTLGHLVINHSDPGERLLDTVTVQSGRRTSATGGPPSAQWDPHAHVWAPADVLSYLDPGDEKVHSYRVAKTDHVLNAASWQTVLTLDKYIAPAALP